MKTTMIKLSGESLKGTESPFNFAKFLALAEVIHEAAESGEHRMFLTVGGGNIIRGKNFTGYSNADDAVDYAGMLASTQNALLLRKALLEHGSRSIVITPDNFTIPECFHREDIRADDRIVLLGGGLGIPGYSTDSSTVKNAAAYGCDEIIFLKMGTDGLYDRNPNDEDEEVRKAAVFIPRIRYKEYCRHGLGAVDPEAIVPLCGTDIVTYIAGSDPEILRLLLRGEPDRLTRCSILTD